MTYTNVYVQLRECLNQQVPEYAWQKCSTCEIVGVHLQNDPMISILVEVLYAKNVEGKIINKFRITGTAKPRIEDKTVTTNYISISSKADSIEGAIEQINSAHRYLYGHNFRLPLEFNEHGAVS
ncbi:MAG: hypothetical protein CVU86_07095 [Firmicutes bacterium HGW-Firmicutes-11]|jgi:hypothetical protein|nr:MAG: hypothetical protein CVU94_00710 [Firmicutes bacterium HGW-Firmicutes-19]PKM84491.1 MAG: hypothetical protein CVU86_07095 [Firmicutes bacterium HGW-Firmicutes-11]